EADRGGRGERAVEPLEVDERSTGVDDGDSGGAVGARLDRRGRGKAAGGVEREDLAGRELGASSRGEEHGKGKEQTEVHGRISEASGEAHRLHPGDRPDGIHFLATTAVSEPP